MTYHIDNGSDNRAQARVARLDRNTEAQGRYLVVLTSIIPALAILAAAASFLMAAG